MCFARMRHIQSALESGVGNDRKIEGFSSANRNKILVFCADILIFCVFRSSEKDQPSDKGILLQKVGESLPELFDGFF